LATFKLATFKLATFKLATSVRIFDTFLLFKSGCAQLLSGQVLLQQGSYLHFMQTKLLQLALLLLSTPAV